MKMKSKSLRVMRQKIPGISSTEPTPVSTQPEQTTKTSLNSLLTNEGQQQNISLNASKKLPTDHYVLQTIKSENNVEGDIDFLHTIGEEGTASAVSDIGAPYEEVFAIEELQSTAEKDEACFEEVVEHVCSKCYRTFRRLTGLQKHIEFCRMDSDYQHRKAEMLKNIHKIEKEAVIMEKKDYCFCCGDSYDTFHLGHINCPECTKSFKSQNSYERHIFLIHSELDDFPCDVCNAKLRSAALLELHKNQHAMRGRPFACRECGKEFTRSYHLRRHQKFSSCGGKESEAFECKVCPRTFLRLDNLRLHLKTHLGSYTAKKEEYSCPSCKKCFYSLSTLNIHVRTHTGERPFDCDLCEKKFPSLVALKKHRRYHTGERPYSCAVCHQAFAVKEVLNRHMKRHTGERPHGCPECGKRFIQATQLKTHARVHLRPHQCDVCEAKFKTEKQLEKHKKKDHKKPLIPKADPKEPKEPKSRKGKKLITKRKSFFCAICDQTLKSYNTYHAHLQSNKHRYLQTVCHICLKNFDSVKSLEFHKLKEHEHDVAKHTVEGSPKKILNQTNKLPKLEEEEEDEEEEEAVEEEEQEDEEEEHEEVVEEEEEAASSNVNKAEEYDVVFERIVNEISADVVENNTESNKFMINTTDREHIDDNMDGDTVMVDNFKKEFLEENFTATNETSTANKEEDDGMEIDAAEDDEKLKENVTKLLDLLVDKVTLQKFGWPSNSEENVLRKVIENCGYDLSQCDHFAGSDYVTRMREYVKLLFTVVIHNDSIKELLNNYSIDEVIEYVLSNDDDDDDDDDVDS